MAVCSLMSWSGSDEREACDTARRVPDPPRLPAGVGLAPEVEVTPLDVEVEAARRGLVFRAVEAKLLDVAAVLIELVEVGGR